MPPRVALLSPFGRPPVRGNAVTVARVERGLRERGLEVGVWELDATSALAVAAEVEGYDPALIHAFHAYRAGPPALRLARRAEIPLVVTLTGTDANHDLFDPERAATVRRVLEGAVRVTVFHASVGERVSRALPDLRAKIVVVPQAVRLDSDEPFDLDRHWALPPGAVLFLLPGGIRPVKRPLAPLRPLERLHARQPGVRLLYAGPELDPGEGEALRAALAGRPWARWIGPVDHARIATLLSRADVVMNCSESEGGMANSVLEALALGRAVLASDIEGNRSLVQHDVTGLLYRDEVDCERLAARLAADPDLRARLGRAGRALVEARYTPTVEIDGYLGVYREVAAVAA